MGRWLDRLGAWVDRAVVDSPRMRGDRDPRIGAMAAEERLARLEALRPRYDDPALLAPGAFLRPGGPIAPLATPARTRLGPATDLSWPSDCAPWDPELAEGYRSVVANRTASARVFAGAAAGPVVVVLHGYGAGHHRIEQWLWPIRAWQRAGCAVALATLPFHGLRAEPGRRTAPRFPATDPRFTHEGFRQAVHDLGALIGWLRARGHDRVSLAGMSLGGYTAALLATVLPGLDRAALVLPLGSLADFALQHGRLGEGAQARALHDALEAVYRPSSPLSRPPLLPPDRVRVVAARGDRVTGVAHAERLAAHFGVAVEQVGGSHLVQRLPWDSLVAWSR